MKKGAKIALIVGLGGVALCGIGGFVLYGLSGIGPESAALPKVYAESEAMGLPLTASDLSKGAPTTPNRYAELEPLIKDLKSLSGGADAWLPGADPESAQVRTEFAASRKETEALVAWIGRHDHFRAQYDFTKGTYVMFPEQAYTKNPVKLMAALAAAQAREGNSRAAQTTLRAAVKLTREMTAHPTLIHGLVRLACHAIIDRSTLTLMEIDRRNAAAYARAASDGVEYDPAFHLRGEVYFLAWTARNLSPQEIADLANPDTMEEQAAAATNRTFIDGGMPTNPVSRSMMAAGLRTWNRVYATADESGRFPDWQHTLDALQAEAQRLERSRRVPDQLMNVLFPVFEQAFDAFKRGRASQQLTAALGRVMSFRDRNGRWPRSLQDAGVQPIPDPNAPGQFAKYRADAAGVSIWVSGLDGDDDGGVVESSSSGTRDGDYAVGYPLKRIGLPLVPRSRPQGGPPGGP
jgi:hypothetical protein